MGLPNITFMDEYIRDGHKAIYNLKNFYDTMIIGDVDKPDYFFRIPISDFFTIYRRELSESVQFFNVPDKFFCRPKMLSLELYDTTEMWVGLLRLNAMRNVTEFTQAIIKVYNPDTLKELINIFFKREGKKT